MLKKQLMTTEKQLLHDPFAKFLKVQGLKYIHENWLNHKNQADSGHFDFIISLPKGRTIHIEFKTPEKIITKNFGMRPKQIEWENYLFKNGHEYYILSDVDKAIDIILSAMP